ncbi:MAG: DUF2292 domain-containing protein [Candidatus Levybacteria bacterium]|nr:DUF2292 domain-containing protein [Candidatus Levybacteria bacterium]
MNDYSTKEVSKELIDEVTEALKNVRGWGSVEIYVQNYKVVQITERNIKKTNQDSSLGRTVKIGS